MSSSETTVNAAFIFLATLPIHEKEKPYEIWCQSDPKFPKTNCTFEEHAKIKVEDMRRFDHGFGYDHYGFRPVHWPSSTGLKGSDCTSSAESDNLMRYLQETAAFVEKEFAAEKVICFDWRVWSPSSTYI
jgi:hypothetical protein